MNNNEELIQLGFEEFKKKEPYPHIDKHSFFAGAEYILNLKDKWISVKNKLPECNQPYYDWQGDIIEDLKCSLPVVVLTDDNNAHIVTLNQNYDIETMKPSGEPYWFDENKPSEGDWLNGLVTHWYPLPEISK